MVGELWRNQVGNSDEMGSLNGDEAAKYHANLFCGCHSEVSQKGPKNEVGNGGLLIKVEIVLVGTGFALYQTTPMLKSLLL